jgi:lipopolysaccharide/colanic/teichoic acid biosynthesis glycosyltransferase
MYLLVKRAIDILLSLIAITLLSPILVVISLILSVTGEKEILYLQERVGFRNKRFKIWKFATMLKNSPNLGTGTLTLRNDPRVTKIGRFLRITKLNELPQLFNVLFGDMSLIGPRPLMPKDAERYSSEIRESIYNVKPGITGIGSVVFRDEELLVSSCEGDKIQFYADVIMPHKGALELWYQKNLSLRTDFLILFLTCWQIIVPSSKLVYKVFPDLPVLTTSLVSA